MLDAAADNITVGGEGTEDTSVDNSSVLWFFT